MTRYGLWIGSSAGSYDLYAAWEGANLSAAISGLPTDGGAVYIRLISDFGGIREYNDYSFTAATN